MTANLVISAFYHDSAAALGLENFLARKNRMKNAATDVERQK